MRRLIPVLIAAVAAAVPTSLALAAGSGGGQDPAPTPTTVPPDTPPPTIAAEVTIPPDEEEGTPGTAVIPVPCSWSRVPATQEFADTLNGVYEVIEVIIQVIDGDFVVHITFYSEDDTLHRYDDESGRYEYQVVADCTNANAPGGWSTGDTDWWEASEPDPAILLPGTRRRVTEPIEPPTPDISPVEGVVNLGMWLAVEQEGQVSVTAFLGPSVWARTTAGMAETSFTFETASGPQTVTCERFGTPIPESAKDSPDEGPCGFTFSEAIEGGSITVTSTWAVTWELSDGRTGSFESIEVTEFVPYDVIEIQTVGTRN